MLKILYSCVGVLDIRDSEPDTSATTGMQNPQTANLSGAFAKIGTVCTQSIDSTCSSNRI